MYEELCEAEASTGDFKSEKAKLKRDVEALVKDVAGRDRDLAHKQTEVESYQVAIKKLNGELEAASS